jgi:hypothetical protein
MRMGRLGFTPDASRTVHTVAYTMRPRFDPQFPVPMPTDPHRAPRNTLAVWPSQRGKK